jgi:hypothetical protein
VGAKQVVGRRIRESTREKHWNIIVAENGMTGDVYEEGRVLY